MTSLWAPPAAGGAVCWSDAEVRQLARGASPAGAVTLRPAPWPVEVPGITDAVEIAAGRLHACARRRSGEVLCWGWVHDETGGPDVPPDAPLLVDAP